MIARGRNAQASTGRAGTSSELRSLDVSGNDVRNARRRFFVLIVQPRAPGSGPVRQASAGCPLDPVKFHASRVKKSEDLQSPRTGMGRTNFRYWERRLRRRTAKSIRAGYGISRTGPRGRYAGRGRSRNHLGGEAPQYQGSLGSSRRSRAVLRPAAAARIHPPQSDPADAGTCCPARVLSLVPGHYDVCGPQSRAHQLFKATRATLGGNTLVVESPTRKADGDRQRRQFLQRRADGRRTGHDCHADTINTKRDSTPEGRHVPDDGLLRRNKEREIARQASTKAIVPWRVD